MKKDKEENKFEKEQYLRAIDFISKIKLPLNISRKNYIRNCLNEGIITFNDIPADILENYKQNINFKGDEISIANAIKKFKSLNLEYDITKNIETNINNFMVKYIDCFANINPPILYIKTSINYSFFRMRLLSDIVDCDNIEEYSYPKNNFKLGRANLPNKPVFYCSLSPITAIDEMKIPYRGRKSIKYVISKWKMKDSNKAISIVPTFTKETEHHFNKMIEQANIKYTEQQKLYLQFIGGQLLSDNYLNSAFLAYNLIYENNIDTITYPSTISNKYPNMAISPQLIDNGTIVLDKVYFVEMLPNKNISLDKIGVFSDKKTEWILKKQLSSNNKYFQEFKNDFKI